MKDNRKNNKKNNKNSLWKEIILKRWEKLVFLYMNYKYSPTFKLLLKIIWALFKIIISTVLKHFFSKFF